MPSNIDQSLMIQKMPPKQVPKNCKGSSRHSSTALKHSVTGSTTSRHTV